MKFNFKGAYEGLGNSKSQRFWRAFLIASLLSGVLIYGFKSEAIKISLGFGSEESND